MAANPPIWTANRWRKFAVVAGLWTLLAFVSAGELYVSQIAWDKPIHFSLAVRRSLEEWYLWALLTPIILWLSRRFPLERLKLRRWLGAHFAGALGVSVIYMLAYSAVMNGQKSIDGTTFEFVKVFKKMFFYHLEVDMIIYWLIVAVHQGAHYYRQNRERELQAAELSAELVQSRLEALRMQLNPHFLFNTLHAISALIYENPEAADRIVARLSELLRVSLEQSDSHEVPLEEELAFLGRYLEIEQTRFQDRLVVEMQIEPGLEKMLVPSLILQPLVENAVRHGIEPREEPGRVIVSARRKDGRLELKVTDNGPGLPENSPVPSREGVGLSNSRSRLTHLYGADHQFILQSAPGGGLAVTLLIPCRGESDQKKSMAPTTPVAGKFSINTNPASAPVTGSA